MVSAPQTALVWPGGGRMLAAPLVVGASVLGDGALEMVGDTITPVGGNAPQELSLRVLTLVANNTGGLSAVLRFLTPVVWLHSWRNHVVRQTMTVLVSAPSGAVDAVRLQPDGSAVTGTMVSGGFVPSGPGRALVAGNDVVFDLPASMGVKPDWTVQAIVEVQADEPLHKNRPATGYAAGTSVVPVGLLTGAASPPAGWAVADAITALTSPGSGPAGVAGMRPVAIRVEGSGADLAAVVTLDGPVSKIALTSGPDIEVDVAPAGFATLDHPVRVMWHPGSVPPQAIVSIDTTIIGEVPVSVSGSEVRFALGGYIAQPSVTVPDQYRLGQMRYHTMVPLGLDEAYSADGLSVPPTSSDTADLNVAGPNVTITPTSTGIPAHGWIDSTGSFVAYNQTDYYTGLIDSYGNVVIDRTTTATTPNAPTGSAGLLRPKLIRPKQAADPTVSIDDDYSVDDAVIAEQMGLWTRDREYFKRGLDNGPAPLFFAYPYFANPFESFAGLRADPADLTGTASAQGGWPDFPLKPTVEATAVGGTGSAAVRAVTGTIQSGNPIDITTPWIVASLLASTTSPTPPTTPTSSSTSPTSPAAPTGSSTPPTRTGPPTQTATSATQAQTTSNPVPAPGSTLATAPTNARPTPTAAHSSGNGLTVTVAVTVAITVVIIIVIVSGVSVVVIRRRRNRSDRPKPSG